MSTTDQALSLLNADPDVVPGARSLLAEELIKGSYEDGAAPMPERLAALKADPRYAFTLHARDHQGGSGANLMNQPVVATEPAPGSVEFIAARMAAGSTPGLGLRAANVGPSVDLAKATTVNPPAPEPWRPDHDQVALGAGLASYCQNAATRRAGEPSEYGGFGLKPIG